MINAIKKDSCGHGIGLVNNNCFQCHKRVEHHVKFHVVVRVCAKCNNSLGSTRMNKGLLYCKKCEQKAQLTYPEDQFKNLIYASREMGKKKKHIIRDRRELRELRQEMRRLK